ncbi:MAG: ATP-binding protein [Lachnospiraceae bacterium]|nr:ATP-binding protein [Lachnospiraceae bacterium]
MGAKEACEVRTIGIGHQDFGKIITDDIFYVDKTDFIREWWENQDCVTLITRPRRFGKTLTMSMVEQFFSVKYADGGRNFQGLSIWQYEKFRSLQGTYPVISLSFASVKEKDYRETRRKICQILVNVYNQYDFLLEADCLTEKEKEFFRSVSIDMGETEATMALNQLSLYLMKYYGKKVMILLDEYDTPMQEAYLHGYWEDAAFFMRSLLNASFKTNPFMERAILTGITKISKESIFSDLNNLEIVTTTSDKYASCFGFTEEEVFAALKEYDLYEAKEAVKFWYNGFTFGEVSDIYNPWSILNYLEKRRLAAYWANTSSNSFAGSLLQTGSARLKADFERLLQGKILETEINEQIVFDQLGQDETAVWSLLLAAGYLKIKDYHAGMTEYGEWKEVYRLELTDFEVKVMFRNMIRSWFKPVDTEYNDFIRAMLRDDLDSMNDYMNSIALAVFSCFDTGNHPSGKAQPERFYHGFVLGLMVELSGRYRITSNRESGYGRYDVMLEPQNTEDDAILLEFKVYDSRREKSLEETVARALDQINSERYTVLLEAAGITADRIRSYGFAFQGKRVLIGGGRHADYRTSDT